MTYNASCSPQIGEITLNWTAQQSPGKCIIAIIITLYSFKEATNSQTLRLAPTLFCKRFEAAKFGN
jgi:hypothetical protein